MTAGKFTFAGETTRRSNTTAIGFNDRLLKVGSFCRSNNPIGNMP